MTTAPDTSVLAAARAWLDEDPDPDTRAELARLLRLAESDGPGSATAVAAVRDRFSARLQFGTAGLRGALGAGPNRMNRVVVIRAAAGLAAYLRRTAGSRVVIGYDARHKSELFARDTAAVLTGAGLRAFVLPRALPTPVLAFAVRHLGCDAGVMVTASHNPAEDNGYKVYLGDGSQIVPPADAEISAAIDAVGALSSVPLGDGGEILGSDVVDAYVDRAAAVALPGTPRQIDVVYTPLHGVGADVLLAVLRCAGFPEPHVVERQAAPDPDFPTVTFPNPEEPGALDLAMAAARSGDADLVLANDPDADRCAAAYGDRTLTGDELGALLGTWLVRRDPALRGAYASTIVSSSLLAKIAAAAGLRHEETLTGFKWLARVPGLRYAYEEAIGYCVDPDGVRDKDGISAAVLLLELAAALRAEGRTLDDMLDDIAREHGVHLTAQVSLRVQDLSQIPSVMTRLREDPPARLGDRDVVGVDDLSRGGNGLPPTDALRFRLDGGARVIARPSGTEPKLKCYLEVVEPVGADGDVATARAAAGAAMERLRSDVSAAVGA